MNTGGYSDCDTDEDFDMSDDNDESESDKPLSSSKFYFIHKDFIIFFKESFILLFRTFTAKQTTRYGVVNLSYLS